MYTESKITTVVVCSVLLQLHVLAVKFMFVDAYHVTFFISEREKRSVKHKLALCRIHTHFHRIELVTACTRS